MQFSRNFPEQLKSSILVSEIVGKKVKLKSRGKDFTGLCPFHHEKTPSFTVNDEKGFYHCFGCSAHGDIISFTMETEKLSYKDAVLKLASDYKIEIPVVKFDKIDKKSEEKYNLEERDYLILEKICEFFENNLKSSAAIDALEYLKRRNINFSIIKKFRLGFAFDDYNSLHEYLARNGFSLEEILRSGVIGKSENNKLYDKLRSRIIFPITDKKNRVIAFGGRTIINQIPKYLNSSETNFFKKSQTLYNYFLAKKAILNKGYAVIVEGYMDVIGLYKGGLENVVAGLGTALSKEHLQDIFQISEKIIICLDGDNAGVKAAKRALEIALPLVNAKRNIYFTFLPNQLDPDEFINKYGANELEKLFVQSSSLSEALFEFSLLELGVDINNKHQKITPEIKTKLETILNKKLGLITDPTFKKYFSLYYKEQIFYLGKNPQKNNLQDNKKLINNFNYKNGKSLDDNLANNIIALLIKFPNLIDYEDEDSNIRELQFISKEKNLIKDQIIEIYEQDSNLEEKNILLALDNSNLSNNIKDIKELVSVLKDITQPKALKSLRILLLKELLLQIDKQYRQSLSDIDKIETHQTTIINDKITELFNYRSSIEKKIFEIENINFE